MNTLESLEILYEFWVQTDDQIDFIKYGGVSCLEYLVNWPIKKVIAWTIFLN